MEKNLTAKAVNGLKWSSLSAVANAGMQLTYTALMARLLAPAAFGLVAAAGVTLQLGSYLANMGLAQAIIQKEELTEADTRAAFTSSLLLGGLFSGLFWLLAPLATHLLPDPSLPNVVRAMALGFVINGFSATAANLLRRRMDFRTLSRIELTATLLAYFGVGVLGAGRGWGAWSLVGASLAQATLLAAGYYAAVRHPLALGFTWAHYRPLLSFGSRSSLIGFVEFLGLQLDSLLIGRLLGSGPLGVYSRAAQLVNLPMSYVQSGMGRVLFPAFSAIQTQTARLRQAYLSATMLLAFAVLPTCVGMSLAAAPIVGVVLGAQWAASVPVLRVLALAFPFLLLMALGGLVCDATATLRVKLIAQTLFLLGLGALMLALRGYGLLGFASAYLIAMVVRNVVFVFIVQRVLHFRLAEVGRAYVPALFTTAVVGAGIGGVAWLTQEWPPLASLPLLVLTGTFCLGLSLLAAPNRPLTRELSHRLGTRLALPAGVRGRLARAFGFTNPVAR